MTVRTPLVGLAGIQPRRVMRKLRRLPCSRAELSLMTNERDRVPCAREIVGDPFPHRSHLQAKWPYDEAWVTEAAEVSIRVVFRKWSGGGDTI